MTPLESMRAALRGEPFDVYPYVNTHTGWSMLPHLPEITGGLNFLYLYHGSDEQRLLCHARLTESIGQDWLHVPFGRIESGRYRIEEDDGVPVLIDTAAGTTTRYEEFPKDAAVSTPRYSAAAQVESLPPVRTAEQIAGTGDLDITQECVRRYGSKYFTLASEVGPFCWCYYNLGFDALFDAMLNNPALMFAMLERHTEELVQSARAYARAGVHGMRIFEFFCSADMISDADFMRFAFPYLDRLIRTIKAAGMTAVFEMMGWVGPRLPRLAQLEPDAFSSDASLKNHVNDVGEYRKAFGESVCILGNIHAVDAMEKGDRNAWRTALAQQARGVGEYRRYVICNGTPTTWATPPSRLREFGEFARTALAEMVPPRG